MQSHLISAFEAFGSEISAFDASKHGDWSYMKDTKNA
jgi:hypothetical protein